MTHDVIVVSGGAAGEAAGSLGAFAACPGASALIMEAVLAIKLSVPISVLADAVHPFPTASRVLGNLMADAARSI